MGGPMIIYLSAFFYPTLFVFVRVAFVFFIPFRTLYGLILHGDKEHSNGVECGFVFCFLFQGS